MEYTLFVVLGLLFVSYGSNRTESSASVCYACEEQNDLENCHKLERCGSGEVCYAEKVLTDSPSPRYTLGCLSQQVCNLLNKGVQPIGKRSTHLCQKCCSSLGCNIDVCRDNQPQQTTNMTNGTTARLPTNSTTIFYSSSSAVTAATTATINSAEPIRLVNGSWIGEGRVEIFYDGEWGTVCDDFFGAKDAGVVCDMLGYPREAAVAWPDAHFGAGKGRIWLDDVNCIGNETDILNCAHSQPPGHHNCGENEEVGVTCAKPLRLANGTSNTEGRLEIFHNNQWGTMCVDIFRSQDAGVVCHMLGYPRANAYTWLIRYFGEGSGVAWLDDVECIGNETDIANCAHKETIAKTDCSYHSAVGVMCAKPIRLVDGTSNTEGRVEIFQNGQWGSICIEHSWFGSEEASVACHMLGYPRQNAVTRYLSYSKEGSWSKVAVNCLGRETDIENCVPRKTTSMDFDKCRINRSAVGVTCDQPVRLIDGLSNTEGRLEIIHNGQWGSICDDGFGSEEAGVVCHMLRYPRENAVVWPIAYTSPGSGAAWLDDVVCIGNETDLENCAHRERLGINECAGGDRVGVSCPKYVRLVNGKWNSEGRVEIFVNGQWGKICGKTTSSFDSKAAGVVCHMLGYPREAAVAWKYQLDSVDIWFEEGRCIGNETDIVNCVKIVPSKSFQCYHYHAAVGVTCAIPSDPPEFPSCPPGFLTHSNSCYLFDNTSSVKSYILAEANCSLLNATLVDVETVDERDFIAGVVNTITGSTGEWLTGAKYFNSRWLWNDLQTPISSALITGLGDGPCASFRRHSPWTGVMCDGLPRNYICEKKMVLKSG